MTIGEFLKVFDCGSCFYISANGVESISELFFPSRQALANTIDFSTNIIKVNYKYHYDDAPDFRLIITKKEFEKAQKLKEKDLIIIWDIITRIYNANKTKKG